MGLVEIARVAKPNAVIVVSILNADGVYRFLGTPGLFTIENFILLHLHSRKVLPNMMSACHLPPVNVRCYDANVCVPPLDSEYPGRTDRNTVLTFRHICHSSLWARLLGIAPGAARTTCP